MKRNELKVFVQWIIWFVSYAIFAMAMIIVGAMALDIVGSPGCTDSEFVISILSFMGCAVPMVLLQSYGEKRGFVKAEL